PGALNTVRVTGAAHADGRVGCSLWGSDDGWPTETGKAVARRWTTIRDGAATCVFNDVPAGTYAVSVMHDEDGNGVLRTSVMGFPREGWGVSKNQPLRTFGAPRFRNCSFEHGADGSRMRVRLNY
ncbi:MAG: DUF2141 domain-containing protein, partial [Myxococcota bacterium]